MKQTNANIDYPCFSLLCHKVLAVFIWWISLKLTATAA